VGIDLSRVKNTAPPWHSVVELVETSPVSNNNAADSVPTRDGCMTVALRRSVKA